MKEDNKIYSQEEILNALRMFKDICSTQILCKNCPFFSEEDEKCLIQDSPPCEYGINDNGVWRALK